MDAFLFAPRVCGVRALRVPTRGGPQLLQLQPSRDASRTGVWRQIRPAGLEQSLGLGLEPSPTPRQQSGDAPSKVSALGSYVVSQKVGVFHAGAADGLSLRSPRVPDARGVSGRRRRGRLRTPRGPDADRAFRSRAQERAAAAAGETQGRTQPPRYRQKRSRYAVIKRNQPAHSGANRRPHAVETRHHSRPVGQKKQPTPEWKSVQAVTQWQKGD
jgi:hypothetical protein